MGADYVMELYKINNQHTYIDDEHVKNNSFIGRRADTAELPKYESSKNLLPQPFWDGHDDVIACHDKAWQIAFKNLRKPTPGSGLVSNFIDTAFNGFLFMWDSCFIVMFGKYGSRAFNFQRTLDNLYAKQHRDGFICREISEESDGDYFERHDPSSTGPNVMPWCEWEYFRVTHDVERLSQVFDPLVAYHHWLKANRTWPDGSYWTTGLGSGMDNQPRLQPDCGYSVHYSHGHMIWMDVCMQQVLSAKTLMQMANVLRREDEVSDLKQEAELLTSLLNQKLWSNADSFYYDMWKNGQLSGVKSAGAYWALLADIVPPDKLDAFIGHLDNPKEFKRPTRVPTLSADHPMYVPDGWYWRGGVWAPTNYMILKGLNTTGYHQLAYEIAESYLNTVVDVYNKTGTLWENYAPESSSKGGAAKDDFVGWTGLAPISVLFEYVFGIQPDSERNKIVWRINRTERHGILNYPFGDATLDLICEARKENEPPNITVCSNKPVTIEIYWANGQSKTIEAQTVFKKNDNFQQLGD